jgi:hypothetical protein
MRKIVTLATIAAAFIAMAAPAAAQTAYYGSYLNQPRSYGTPSYAPPPPPPAYIPPPPPPVSARPGITVTRPGYGSGAYYDYRHFGDPTTRDSLLTCSYC